VVWCSDLTRIVYRGTVWYLATIEDVVTRQIIARKVGNHHNSQLVLYRYCNKLLGVEYNLRFSIQIKAQNSLHSAAPIILNNMRYRFQLVMLHRLGKMAIANLSSGASNRIRRS
jgi:hypothetical protein